MNTITIEGIRCSLISSNKMLLELPQGINGDKLAEWKSRNRLLALSILKGENISEVIETGELNQKI